MAQMWDRVIVGVDGSLASLGALRRAIDTARLKSAPVHAVLVFGREVVGHTTVEASVPPDRRLLEDGRRRIDDAFARSLGGTPADVDIATHIHAYEGNAGTVLVALADRPTDLLVIGASDYGRFFGLLGNSVSRYCIRYAQCPVLVVPLPELARRVRQTPRYAKRLPRWLVRSVSRSRA